MQNFWNMCFCLSLVPCKNVVKVECEVRFRLCLKKVTHLERTEDNVQCDNLVTLPYQANKSWQARVKYSDVTAVIFRFKRMSIVSRQLLVNIGNVTTDQKTTVRPNQSQCDNFQQKAVSPHWMWNFYAMCQNHSVRIRDHQILLFLWPLQ